MPTRFEVQAGRGSWQIYTPRSPPQHDDAAVFLSAGIERFCWEAKVCKRSLQALDISRIGLQPDVDIFGEARLEVVVPRNASDQQPPDFSRPQRREEFFEVMVDLAHGHPPAADTSATAVSPRAPCAALFDERWVRTPVTPFMATVTRPAARSPHGWRRTRTTPAASESAPPRRRR